MCSNHLGGVVDIHGGGADLIFPHHENEIAQSEAYMHREPFARYWVHNGLLQLGGDKMSKSIGNTVQLQEITKNGLATAFRVMVLQSHYRAPVTFTDESLESASNGLDRLLSAARVRATTPASQLGEPIDFVLLAAEVDRRFHDAMNDDFDTPTAVAALFDLARSINRGRSIGQSAEEIEPGREKLIELADVLGLVLDDEAATATDAAPFIDLLVELRQDLRAAKQWSLADRVRDRLIEQGIQVEDTPDGTIWRLA